MLPIQKREYLETKGYDFVNELQPNGMHTVNVWQLVEQTKTDKKITYKSKVKKGSKEFLCKWEAIYSAVNYIYDKIKK